MNGDAEKWARVHELLDQRLDPLADAEVVAWLREDAGPLAAVVSLRAHLAGLAVRRRPRVALRVAAAAAVVVGVISMWFVLRRDRGEADSGRPNSEIRAADAGAALTAPADPTPLPWPTLAPGQLVRRFAASTEIRGDDGSLSVTRVDHALVTERFTRWWAAKAEHHARYELSLLEIDPR